jgi:hypothetical protein
LRERQGAPSATATSGRDGCVPGSLFREVESDSQFRGVLG